RPPRGRAASEPLEVVDLGEPFANGIEDALRCEERLDGVLPALDRLDLAERREDPLPEEPASHGRARRVHRAEERAGALAAAERLDELEAPSRRRIDRHVSLGPVARDLAHVLEKARLLLLGIAKDRVPRADAGRSVVHVEARERRDLELLLEKGE